MIRIKNLIIISRILILPSVQKQLCISIMRWYNILTKNQQVEHTAVLLKTLKKISKKCVFRTKVYFLSALDDMS